MGVSIQCNAPVTEAMLAEQRPDSVVLAAGAAPVTLPIPGIEKSHVFEAREVLTGKVELKGPAVIMGAGYVGMETADYCIARGIRVTLVEMAKIPPVSKLPAHGYWLHRRLRDSDSVLMLGSSVTGIEDGAVVVQQEDKQVRIEPAAMVIKAFGSASERDLCAALQKLNIPFSEAGDVVKPRRLLEAVHEGDRAGCQA
jgi:pyruvate/2-oxoglutarate dehydrogenase complex dihydrolipoamide dehydrogenase (E3) component